MGERLHGVLDWRHLVVGGLMKIILATLGLVLLSIAVLPLMFINVLHRWGEKTMDKLEDLAESLEDWAT